jgi:hypothetical protein
MVYYCFNYCFHHISPAKDDFFVDQRLAEIWWFNPFRLLWTGRGEEPILGLHPKPGCSQIWLLHVYIIVYIIVYLYINNIYKYSRPHYVWLGNTITPFSWFYDVYHQTTVLTDSRSAKNAVIHKGAASEFPEDMNLPPPCLFHPSGRGYIPTLWIVVGSYPETNRGHHFTIDGVVRSDSFFGAFQNAGYLRLAMYRVKMQHLVIISFSWMEFLVCCKKTKCMW